jgi:hypothetical protein
MYEKKRSCCCLWRVIGLEVCEETELLIGSWKAVCRRYDLRVSFTAPPSRLRRRPCLAIFS